MLKKDFLLRQIEDFGRALALILNSKKEKDWEKFEKEIEEISRHYSPQQLSAIENLSLRDFEESILLHSDISLDQKKIIANLLFEKIDLYLAREEEEKLELLKQKCLLIFQHIQNNFTSNQFDLDVHYKLEVLKNL